MKIIDILDMITGATDTEKIKVYMKLYIIKKEVNLCEY